MVSYNDVVISFACILLALFYDAGNTVEGDMILPRRIALPSL